MDAIDDRYLRIRTLTDEYNQDNISRTRAYLNFFLNHPEIEWSLLASCVSRNAGWNMTDLVTDEFRTLLSENWLNNCFKTYEKANWLIFRDAFPQLLIYEASINAGKPMFDELYHFGVSHFMVNAWKAFYNSGRRRQLCRRQVINEQAVIEKPVLDALPIKEQIFHTLPYRLQQAFHMSAVLFPDKSGQLYGFSVPRFQSFPERVKLGFRLAWLLFESPVAVPIRDFAMTVNPTGSRKDYMQYSRQVLDSESPALRTVYTPVTHSAVNGRDWYHRKLPAGLEDQDLTIPPYDITRWFRKKNVQRKWSVKIVRFLTIRG